MKVFRAITNDPCPIDRVAVITRRCPANASTTMCLGTKKIQTDRDGFRNVRYARESPRPLSSASTKVSSIPDPPTEFSTLCLRTRDRRRAEGRERGGQRGTQPTRWAQVIRT